MQKMRQFALVSIFFLLFSYSLKAQEQANKETFLEAESYFLFEEYNEALPYYLKLQKIYPSNDNLAYRIGICYLNNPYEKAKSIDYLLQASKNITSNYKENNFKETKAPYDVLFYLGNAYRVNDQLDQAIKTYEKFKQNLDPKVYDADLVNEQIQACKYALQKENDPMDIVYINLGNIINTKFADINPVVTPDENTMLYVQQQQFQDIILYATKINGEWKIMRDIMFELGFDIDQKVYPTSISPDGKELYLYGVDNYLGTIFVSNLVNGQWTKAKRLNDNINTKYWESHACISFDGKILYFTSNRKGGYGGLDIYKSMHDAKGEWGPAINLGPVINTKYNEETPFITEDGKTLYFSSYGHNSMGGYDVFYSNLLDDGTWSVPVNAGYPINTPDDDLFFAPIKNGTFAYYPRYFTNHGQGKMDIYRYEIYSNLHPHKFQIKGILSLKGMAEASAKGATVNVFDRLKKDTIDRVGINNDKGEYELNLPAGEYDLYFQVKGFIPKIEKLLIPKNYKEGTTLLATTLMAVEKPVRTEEKVIPPVPAFSIKEKYIEVKTNAPIKIRLLIDRPGQLIVRATIDSATIASETLNVKEGRFSYVYTPREGKNIIEFKHTDAKNNTSLDYVVVNFVPETKESETGKVGQLPVLTQTDNPKTLLEALRKMAEGNLKNTLDQVDLKKENINTAGDLIQYLMKHAEDGKYTSQDVIDLLTLKASHLSLQELINLLATYANDDIKKALASVDYQKEGITTSSDLIEYLIRSSSKYGYTKDDVINLMVSAASGANNDAKFLLKKLIVYSSPALQKYLRSLNLDSLRIKDNKALIRYIIANAEKNGFSEKDVIKALVNIISAMPLDRFIRKMANYSDGNLKSVLESLNPSRENINSIPELIDWLIKQAPMRGYTKEDVINALMRMAMAGEDNVPGLLRVMEYNSSGNLNHYLAHLNLSKIGVTSNQSLVDYIITQAQDNRYTGDDVLNSLVSITYDCNAKDAFYFLVKLSEPGKRRKLANADLEDKGLTDLPSLFAFVKTEYANQKVADTSYRKLAIGYFAAHNLNLIVERLKTLSSGNLARYFDELDFLQSDLTDLNSLVQHMLDQSGKYRYTGQDVFDLLEKYRESQNFDQLLNNALLLAHGNLRTAVAEFDPDLYLIYTQKAFADYLFSESSRYKYSRTEVIDLMIKLLGQTNLKPEMLKSGLAINSKGAIKSYVSGLNLSKQKIETTSDLVSKLADNKMIRHEDLYAALGYTIDLAAAGSYLTFLKDNAEGTLKSYAGTIKLKHEKIYSVEDFSSHLKSMASKGKLDINDAVHALAVMQQYYSLDQFIRELTSLSGGGITQVLTQVDIKKDAITSIPQLIKYLIDQGPSHGYSEDDVFKLLMRQATSSELQRFVYHLANASRDSLRKTILELNFKELGLKSPNEVFQYLSHVAAQNGYSEEDLKRALVHISSGMVDEILKRINYLKSLSSRGWISRNAPALITGGLLAILFLILLFSIRRTRRRKK